MSSNIKQNNAHEETSENFAHLYLNLANKTSSSDATQNRLSSFKMPPKSLYSPDYSKKENTSQVRSSNFWTPR